MQISQFALCATLAFAAGSAHALSADELIAKSIEARGGLDKIKAIQSLKIEGTASNAGGGFEIAIVNVGKRGFALRSESTLQGLTMIRAYDGKEAWSINPFRGRKDPDKLSADMVKEIAYQADFDGPLVDYKAKNIKVEYLGTEDVDGTDAHKLKATYANGDFDTIYLDPDYFMQIRVVETHRIRGAEQEQESDFGDYEKVNGVYFPFAIESGSKGASEKEQKITIKKIEANVPVDEAQFRFPTAAAPAK
jgi:outer membrane lipoprotein-sorting protein